MKNLKNVISIGLALLVAVCCLESLQPHTEQEIAFLGLTMTFACIVFLLINKKSFTETI